MALRCEQFPKYQPSELWGIADETVAEAFNLAASYRLSVFKVEMEKARLEGQAARFKLAMMEVLIIAFGGDTGGGQKHDGGSGYQVEGADGRQYANMADYLNAMEGAHPNARGANLTHLGFDETGEAKIGFMPPFENVGGPRVVGQDEVARYGGEAVYVDGEYRGGGERIPMSKEEFKKRTKTPARRRRGSRESNAAGEVWWETQGTPRIIE